ncbi:putative RNA methyltransferase [Allokutzneria albata]|uniref:23S rRNA m(1)G-748 methyltransferase n=1 Tax=Allokutzneria albata TaxID=211114 RepID=A0A1G9XWY6_ALLAB|nr:methyltransferase domain-containing protein [Allokutzneria albata]SDN01290.1 23S rRNA m(1)G-748 methyltransferase [Allokutzneria albata]
MRSELLEHLRCPHCGAPLAAAGNTVSCAGGHSFDIAKQGYLSLLAGGHSYRVDTAEMVAARDAFLGAGHYAPISDALAKAARAPLPPGCVLDIGGGTGHYLRAVLDVLPDRDGIVLDLSKFAARRAAKAHARIGAVVADAWRELPVNDGAAALVLNVFAPRNGPELRRVLHPDGELVVVTPTSAHLGSLVRELDLLTVDERKDERLHQALDPYFTPLGRESVEYSLAPGRDALAQLVGMGPSAWSAKTITLPEDFKTTVSVSLTRYRPKPK